MCTKVGVFSVHRLSPLFFDGFDWYRGKLFSYFPELHFPKSFSLKKAKVWIDKIPNPKVSSHVKRKLAS